MPIRSFHRKASYDPQEEMKLWRRWKAGDDESLGDLMNRMQPIMNKWYGRASYANLPESAVRGELELLTINALDKYDPDRGAKLSTWVEANMPNIHRFVNKHQNVGRIPEHRALRINTYESVKNELEESLGRVPTAMEMSDELGWDMDEVQRMERELRKDLSQSGDFENMIIPSDPPIEEAMNWVYPELRGRDQLVFEWLTGWGGKPILSQNEIADRLSVSPATVSNIKNKIVKKIESAQGLL